MFLTWSEAKTKSKKSLNFHLQNQIKNQIEINSNLF